MPIEPARKRLLDGDSPHRKEFPLATGLLDYFPDALAEVARVSKRGNDKHNPGQPIHHARGKSMDHADCIMRHLAGRGGFDGDTRESASLAWRALALLQEELEQEMGLPLPRGARAAEPPAAPDDIPNPGELLVDASLLIAACAELREFKVNKGGDDQVVSNLEAGLRAAGFDPIPAEPIPPFLPIHAEPIPPFLPSVIRGASPFRLDGDSLEHVRRPLTEVEQAYEDLGLG